MKEIGELNLPANVRYTDDHEWARPEGDLFTIGISDFAQDQLGDITFVEVPEVGDSFAQGEEFGTVESTKAVSELYMPVSGEIVEINPALEDEPGLLNEDCYGEGWIARVKAEEPGEYESLMDRDSYFEHLKGIE